MIELLPQVHCEPKGCKIITELRIERPRKDSSPIRVDFCKIHNVEICRCGIEWGKHSEVNDYIREVHGVQYPEKILEVLEKNK